MESTQPSASHIVDMQTISTVSSFWYSDKLGIRMVHIFILQGKVHIDWSIPDFSIQQRINFLKLKSRIRKNREQGWAANITFFKGREAMAERAFPLELYFVLLFSQATLSQSAFVDKLCWIMYQVMYCFVAQIFLQLKNSLIRPGTVAHA